MNIRILNDQKDLFEMSVLEQTGRLQPGEYQEIITEKSLEPVVLIGKYLNTSVAKQFRELADHIFRSGRAMLILPPFGDVDIGKYMDTPVSLRLVRRPAESECTVKDITLRNRVGAKLKIRSDHIMDTSLSSGILCVDGESKPILLRYQPTNTTGAVFISTLQLLSYTALTEEDDRQVLITEILNWKNEIISSSLDIETQDHTISLPNRDDLVAILLALDAGGSPEMKILKEITEEFLGASISKDSLLSALAYLQSEGIVTQDEAKNRMAISPRNLGQAIEDLGVHAYARELRELVRNH